MEPTPESLTAGAAEVDITPSAPTDLSGFAIRQQPSLGVLDPLYARALFLTDGPTRLLWVHCDLIGHSRELVRAFRTRCAARWGLAAVDVMLSATHTHSGPPTIELTGCGAPDASYDRWLLDRMEAAAETALGRAAPCDMVHAARDFPLAIDRRGRASAHVDRWLSALGFRRPDGSFAAVVANYPIHPVALGPGNRHVSADLAGGAAFALAEALPGRPVAFVTNGACGNLNPPAVGVSPDQVNRWGRAIGDAIAPPLRHAAPAPCPSLLVRSQVVPVPLDALEPAEVAAVADRALADERNVRHWGDSYRLAVERWRSSLSAPGTRPPMTRDIELHLVRCGPAALLGVNAELFSRFATSLRAATGEDVTVVGYANGVEGYIPTAEAYTEGGYEVEAAHFFYSGFRVRAGGLEHLVAAAASLVRETAPATPAGRFREPVIPP